MKKLIAVFVLILATSALSFGDAGVPKYQRTYPHGHANNDDGGAIKLPSGSAYLAAANHATTCGSWAIVKPDTLVYTNNVSWLGLNYWRFIAQTAGYYFLSGTVCANATTTFTSLTAFWYGTHVPDKIGSTRLTNPTANTPTCVKVEGIVYMSVGQYTTLCADVEGTGTCTIEGFQMVNGYYLPLTSMSIIMISR